MAATSEVAICNEAFGKFGAGAIATFDDATSLGRTVRLHYFRVVNDLMTYPWTFLRTVMRLTQLAETPMADNYLASGWRFAYGLPGIGVGGILAAPDRYLATPNRASDLVRDYELQAGVVYCNEATLWARVIQAKAPPLWPPYFRRAAVDSLAYEFVMGVSGNSGLRETLKEEAVGPPEANGRGGSLGRAYTADSLNDSSDTLGRRSPLVDARWS